MHIKIKKGRDLPVSGEPAQSVSDGKAVSSVAVIGPDYIGMKPTMLVKEGEQVKLGQKLFLDKKNPGVVWTSPGCGTVKAVNRGARRVLESVVIDLGGDAEEAFQSYPATELTSLSLDDVRKNLIESGLWTALRTRPYSKVPSIDCQPNSLFITAMDSNPLAPAAGVVIKENEEDFANGVTVLSALSVGKTYVCKSPSESFSVPSSDRIETAQFEGPHPAGLPGTHMHFIDPVSDKKSNWHIGYQDVIAVGKLFTSGRLSTERVIALGGPRVSSPRLLRTRLGACISEITGGEMLDGAVRQISGSVFSGRTAAGSMDYLGRYHTQISVLQEGTEQREFLGWIRPEGKKYSFLNVFFTALKRNQKFGFTSLQNGSPRAMVPIGVFEQLMPLDILPTQLLRALCVQDTDTAQQLGCLELDEEDLALCTFACSGKYDYGEALREGLTNIERFG